MVQIFSVIAVGTQASPTIGGVLYDKTGVIGVFGLGVALLLVDLLLRLLVIEKKVAAKYEESQRAIAQTNGEDDIADEDQPDEDSPLLGEREQQHYRLPEEKSWIVRKVPIFACMTDSALISALWLAFVQAVFLGSFDSTIPTVAEDYYDFNSLRVGLLFLAFAVTDLVTGPIAGWSVDRFGTKPVATIGCLWLVPSFALLRLPQPDLAGGEGSPQVKLWAGLLAVAGFGMGIFGSPSIVEAGAVVDNYYKANREFFGESGPYAQLYGLNSMFFNAGLMSGPLIAGYLKDAIGYGDMNAVMAAIAGVSAIVSFMFIGGKPRLVKKVLRED